MHGYNALAKGIIDQYIKAGIEILAKMNNSLVEFII
jgi:hypothetical protein